MKCSFQGATKIRWFRDGQHVEIAHEDPRSHRLLLPSGSLFFLRVAASRRDNDAGTYWCVGTNSHGATRSRNATLTVATISDDFFLEPEPLVRARTGDVVNLPCKPPSGVPDPSLFWIKDELQISNTTRIYTSTDGNLTITHVLEGDSGTYKCVAKNIAGTRESIPVALTVMGKFLFTL